MLNHFGEGVEGWDKKNEVSHPFGMIGEVYLQFKADDHVTVISAAKCSSHSPKRILEINVKDLRK